MQFLDLHSRLLLVYCMAISDMFYILGYNKYKIIFIIVFSVLKQNIQKADVRCFIFIVHGRAKFRVATLREQNY